MRSYKMVRCSKDVCADHAGTAMRQQVFNDVAILGRCLQHRGGEPEQAKGADGMQL